MEGYYPMKLKRKDLEDVNDDFYDFSLSSPARKIRRLDAELPPIIEEEESDIPIVSEQPLPQGQTFGSRNSSGGITIEELPSLPDNDERAIVLFKPMNSNPLVQSPSSFSVSVDPHLISKFKNQVLWSNQSNSWRLGDDEAAENNNSGSGSECLAVVPWTPSNLSSSQGAEVPSEIDNSEMMDAEEMEEATMDIEDGTGFEQSNVNESGGMDLSEGFHQWQQQQQQQHCLTPQPPQNTKTPIVWYQ